MLGWRAGVQRLRRHSWVMGGFLALALAVVVASMGSPSGTTALPHINANADLDPPAVAAAGLADDASIVATPSTEPALSVAAQDEVVPTPTAQRVWQRVEVRPGQSMDRIFKTLDLSPKLLYDLVRIDDKTSRLVTIKPGDVFFFALDNNGEFQALKGEHDEAHWLIVEATPTGDLVSTLEPRQLERRVVEAQATIDSSLFNAAIDAGLSNNMTMQLANVFAWDIDFALDIRAGDRFSLLYEEIWRDGEFFRDGALLAARFVNRGNAFEAVRFAVGDDADYYDLDGRPMRKAFLRAPLNFTRVTSNFNPKRFHPVTRRVRPHNGTDYGAATGTPVWAAGDGTVIESAYNRANGHYVFVQHGNHIVTRYLHLNRRDVQKGERVKQGETIGTVGSTGLATGPHLHYEFLVNGAHRDPRKVDLPPVEPLPEIERQRFLAHSQPLIERLNRFDEQAQLLASMNPAACQDTAESC